METLTERQKANGKSKQTNKQKSNSKKTELIKRTPIENSPFYVVSKENKHFVAFGKYKITEEKDTIEEAFESIEKPNWNTIISVISIVKENLTENK